MNVLIDNREQKPLEFDTILPVRATLSIGDYRGVFNDGTFSKTVFERKSIGDLYGTLSKGYIRFQKELNKAQDLEIKLVIIVEGSLNKVLKGYKRSKRDPLSIIQQLFTIRNRYGVGTVFCSDREEMANYITFAFLAEHRRYLETKKKVLTLKRKKI